MKRIFRSILFASIAFISFESHAQEWHTNIEEARVQAEQEDHNLLVVFQGSDWCAPCIKLEKEVWSSEVFQEYANKELELVQVDFPRRKKNKLSEKQAAHNAKLAEQYNTQGIFPFVVLLDAAGNVLAETGYKSLSASKYTDHLKTLLSSN